MSSSSLQHAYALENQPSLGQDLTNAVISWMTLHGQVYVLSRFPDDQWEGAPIGSLANSVLSARTIDFSDVPECWRDFVRCSLYWSLRHPSKINKTPVFPTLMKKSRTLFKFVNYLESVGIATLDEATPENAKAFLLEVCRKAKHPETVISTIGALLEVNTHFQQGLLKYKLPFPPMRRGAMAVGKALWRDEHPEDVGDWKIGYAPLNDVDTSLTVRSCLFYIDTLSKSIISASNAVLDIQVRYPDRKFNRSQEAKCGRESKKFLSTMSWHEPECGYHAWPPETAKQLNSHVRLLSAACAVLIFLLLGCRRSEFLELKIDCLRGKPGEEVIRIVYRKGEDALEQGRPVDLAASPDIVKAVETQKLIRSLVNDDLVCSGERPIDHDFLFVQLTSNAAHSSDESEQAEDDSGRYRRAAEIRIAKNRALKASTDEDHQTISSMKRGAPLTDQAINGFLRDFGLLVTTGLDGRLAPHRLRKTAGRLTTLSMEGAALILNTIFGHLSYDTTLRYMLASPFIQDEVTEAYPELLVKNLELLYRSRAKLGGGGGRKLMSSIKEFELNAAAALLGHETGMSESEFIELALKLMEQGHMMLSVLGPGIYCLKPPLARGPCSDGLGDSGPNIGACQSKCQYNVQTEDRIPAVAKTITWLESKVNDADCSVVLRNFYSAHLAEHKEIFGVEQGE